MSFIQGDEDKSKFEVDAKTVTVTGGAAQVDKYIHHDNRTFHLNFTSLLGNRGNILGYII